jgi:hypothetical protein
MKRWPLIPVVVFALLVLTHPAAAAAVLPVEAAVCGGLAWLTYRGLRAALLPPYWRTA